MPGLSLVEANSGLLSGCLVAGAGFSLPQLLQLLRSALGHTSFSSHGAQAQLLHGMWNLPRPGIKPVSLEFVGGFFTTGPSTYSQGDVLIQLVVYKDIEIGCQEHLTHRCRAHKPSRPAGIFRSSLTLLGFPCGSAGKEFACNAGHLGLIPGLGRFPWRREWLPTPVFRPGEFHGLCSPWGSKSRTQLRAFHTHTHTRF